ncbi:MAG: SDR family NAD(P)-dependent oxidoreductase [Acidobacteria bacterium]|nr:SDR family NAD(P)-dependent oxidoreductase [Acidobacteriota bacterium]
MSAFGSVRKDLKWIRQPLAQDALKGLKAAAIGGTNGIGRALVRQLVGKGAEVLVIGRTFRDKGLPGLSFIQADLSKMKEARKIAQQLPAEMLDMLIMTQGIMAGRRHLTTPEGIEMDMAVSHLSRFVMVREIAERLGKNRSAGKFKPRIFVMGFPGTNQKGNLNDFNSEDRYSFLTAHSNTVIGNEALVLDGAVRYPKVNFYGLNPGIIKSGIITGILGERSLIFRLQQILVGALFQSADEYAERILPLLVSPDIEGHSGAMFGRYGDPIHASASLLQKPCLQRVVEESEKLAKKALL